jgi:hypothetical protein
MTKVGAAEFDICPYLGLYTLDTIIGEYIKLHLENLQVEPFCWTCTQVASHKYILRNLTGLLHHCVGADIP